MKKFAEHLWAKHFGRLLYNNNLPNTWCRTLESIKVKSSIETKWVLTLFKACLRCWFLRCTYRMWKSWIIQLFHGEFTHCIYLVFWLNGNKIFASCLVVINPLSTSPTICAICRLIIWVCLTLLWSWCLQVYYVFFLFVLLYFNAFQCFQYFAGNAREHLHQS